MTIDPMNPRGSFLSNTYDMVVLDRGLWRQFAIVGRSQVHQMLSNATPGTVRAYGIEHRDMHETS